MMVKEGTSPFVFDKSRPSRFGVLPRYASDASQIRWFETDALVAFHTVREQCLEKFAVIDVPRQPAATAVGR